MTDKDFTPVLVPNVIRGADDFVAGATDTFFFAFGAPKVREVDATVGDIRALKVPQSGMEVARTIFAEGYLAPATPGQFFIGVEKPMGVYTWDNLLFTNAKYYGSYERYVFALASELRKEYEIIVASGFLLQLDARDFGLERARMFKDKSDADFLPP